MLTGLLLVAIIGVFDRVNLAYIHASLAPALYKAFLLFVVAAFYQCTHYQRNIVHAVLLLADY